MPSQPLSHALHQNQCQHIVALVFMQWKLTLDHAKETKRHQTMSSPTHALLDGDHCICKHGYVDAHANETHIESPSSAKHCWAMQS